MVCEQGECRVGKLRSWIAGLETKRIEEDLRRCRLCTSHLMCTQRNLAPLLPQQLNCAGLRIDLWVCHTIHLVWSQKPGQYCTYSGGIWSTLFYSVLTEAMSDPALWLLRNPETARLFDCLILQANGSLGLPRNKRTVVPLFTFYLEL